MSGHQDTPSYYMPYDSEEDTGTETGTDTGTDTDEDYDSSSLPDYEDIRIRREQDPRYALIRTAGPNLNTSEQQLKYMEGAAGAPYDNNTNITSLSSLVYLNPPKTTVTSLFSVKAINRDRRVYPSPFNFEIKLPRVYKNVTKFQLVQLSFPNNSVEAIVTSSRFDSTFVEVLLLEGVPPECISTCITLTESGTTSNSYAIAEEGRLNYMGRQMINVFSVPDGIYTNSELANELNKQSNNTPPLNIISYSDFKEIFKLTGDASILFNEPGDIYFSRFTPNKIHKFCTKETIMNTYYSQHHINTFLEITDTIAFNAYYYPILKELLATNRSQPFLNFDNYSYSQIYDMVINNFYGLDNQDYYIFCSTNQAALDGYRKLLTFELKSVNKYQWEYDDTLKQFKCFHNSIHPSLQKDIRNNLNYCTNNTLNVCDLDHNSFKCLKNKNNNDKLILRHMETYLSTKLYEYLFLTDYKYEGGNYHIGNSTNISYEELHNDEQFTNMFNLTTIFGNQMNISPGSKFTFRNFLDYHSTMSSYYNITQSTTSTINTIHNLIYDNHHTYVKNKYSNVLPNNFIENRVYDNENVSLGTSFVGGQYLYVPGDSVSFNNILSEEDCTAKCKEVIRKLVLGWYSCLPVNVITNSVSYRLGLTSIDTINFTTVSTVLANTSTGRTNYLLQVNNDQSFNNMDIAMTENYTITNETTGQVKLMYGKILTGGLGSGEIAQTVIQNPVIFETPLGKLDKLQFKIYYDDVNITPGWLVIPFEIGFADWDATFQIDEEVGFADRNSGWGNNPTVPIPNDPSALQYMALTTQNNPNNKSFP
jgi:hypothetical protein